MSSRPASLVLLALLGVVSVGALASPQEPPSKVETEAALPPKPTVKVPEQPPPPPPSQIPEPPASRPQPPDEQLPAGQWVYTEQYGWVWMPKGNTFTHVPADGGTPHMYLYYPDNGWCWVVAPWIWGWGPRPYFGLLGPFGFSWWGHGFGHWYGFEGRYGRWGHGGWGVYHGGIWHHEGPRGTYGGRGPGRGLSAPWQGGRSGGRAPRIR
jgi:hypothetical protein